MTQHEERIKAFKKDILLYTALYSSTPNLRPVIQS